MKLKDDTTSINAACESGVTVITAVACPLNLALLVYKINQVDDVDGDDPIKEALIHIRIQQRNGRKTLTTVQGIHEKFDKKSLLKAFKKKFSCNGNIVNHEEYGQVIQLQGDQREILAKFLVEKEISTWDSIRIHGF